MWSEPRLDAGATGATSHDEATTGGTARADVRGGIRDVALVLCAAALLAFSLLAILPAPTYRLWQAAIVATEWGFWLAPLGLLPLVGWRRSRAARAAALLGITAAALLISPIVRAAEVWRASSGSGFRALAGALVADHGGEVEPQRLRYAAPGGEPLVLDLYLPPSRDRTPPVVVVIHGGSWQGGDPGQLPRLNSILAERGYAVAAIAYRHAPRHRFPAQLEDVAAALSYLKARSLALGVDADRIVLLGRSAGGQLALLAAYSLRDPSIRGAVSLYGPTDLAWGFEHPSAPRVHDSRGILAAYLGGPLDTHAAAYAQASPISFADAAVPTLLVHGRRDELVSVEHARRLARALDAAGRRYTYLELPWATHGCDFAFRGPCGQVTRVAIERFLRTALAD
jgi:acetyl esterase/lipase